MYVLYVLTYCLRAIKQSEKAKANALKEEFIQKWKFSDYLLNPVPEMFCVTTKLHMTFYQDECEKVMTGFVFVFFGLGKWFWIWYLIKVQCNSSVL